MNNKREVYTVEWNVYIVIVCRCYSNRLFVSEMDANVWFDHLLKVYFC